jgi:hypothetical protein
VSLPATSTLSGEVTSIVRWVSVSSHSGDWVVTMHEIRAKSPATKRSASMTWPLAMVSVLAPALISRFQVWLDGPAAAPPTRMQVTWQAKSSPT